MNLDDLKSNWQNQKSPAKITEQHSDHLVARLKDFDKKLSRQNWLISLAFGISTPLLLTIFFYFTDFGWIFYATIIGVVILMAVSSWLFWKRRLLSKQQDLSMKSLPYLEGRIAQLEYNKKITTVYMPIYAVILTSLLMLYTAEVGKLLDPKILAMAYLATLSYIALVMFFGMRRQRRKDREEIDPMLEELRAMKRDWKK